MFYLLYLQNNFEIELPNGTEKLSNGLSKLLHQN